MSQRRLGDYSEDDTLEETETFRPSVAGLSADILSDEREPFADLSCPWCLEPSDNFVRKDDEGTLGRVKCPNCDAVIPIEADWYLTGEKIVL